MGEIFLKIIYKKTMAGLPRKHFFIHLLQSGSSAQQGASFSIKEQIVARQAQQQQLQKSVYQVNSRL